VFFALISRWPSVTLKNQMSSLGAKVESFLMFGLACPIFVFYYKLSLL
jgi:hypothetical protein